MDALRDARFQMKHFLFCATPAAIVGHVPALPDFRRGHGAGSIRAPFFFIFLIFLPSNFVFVCYFASKTRATTIFVLKFQLPLFQIESILENQVARYL